MKRLRFLGALAATLITASLLGAAPAAASPDPSVSSLTGKPSAKPARVEKGLAIKAKRRGGVQVNVLISSRAVASTLSAKKATGKVVRTFSKVPMVTMNVTAKALRKLRNTAGVLGISEDKPRKPTLADSIPLIGADKTQADGLTGKGQAVAILDTGVATQHPFLKGRIAAEACYSQAGGRIGTSLCPNGQPEQEGSGSANAEAGECAKSELDCAHGSHVAGIAAGNKSGASGAPGHGVAPEAKIVAIQVFTRIDDAETCGGASRTPCPLAYDSDIIAGLEKVADLNSGDLDIAAANMSLGGGGFTEHCDDSDQGRPMKQAMEVLKAAGVASVTSAGNGGERRDRTVGFPACVSTAVTVGNTTKSDRPASSSDDGKLLDIWAPGSQITSSVPGNRYAAFTGTSMAAPHIAGSFAVMKQAFPNRSVAWIEKRLEDTGKNISYSSGGEQFTQPRVQLNKAAEGSDPDPTPTDDPDPTPTDDPDPTPTDDPTDDPRPCNYTTSPAHNGQWWMYRLNSIVPAVPVKEQNCLVAAADRDSKVFSEARKVSNPTEARKLLAATQSGGSAKDKLDRELLTAWLNYHAEAIQWNQQVGETTFGDGILLPAENTRLNGTPEEMLKAAAKLRKVNNA